MWSNCWVSDRVVEGEIFWSIKPLPYSYRFFFLNLCCYCWGGGFFPYILLHCRVLSENNWRPALGCGKYWYSECDMICYFTNKWFPAIPIISILNICINKRGTYSVFFLPISDSWRFECAVRVENILDQKHKNSVCEIFTKFYSKKHKLRAEIL